MKDVLSMQWRVLTFRMRPADVDALGTRHLAFGLLVTWLVGVGRWWDHPDAKLVQHAGLGSVAYVFVLAALLWLPIKALKPAHGSYVKALTIVTLTALPGLLYAIPVQRWADLDTANVINMRFLAIVAAWRVAAWMTFLIRTRTLPWWPALAGTLLPLGGVVTALTALNLERAVFDFMGDLQAVGTPYDGAYAMLVSATFLVMSCSPIIILAWLATVVVRHRRRAPPAGA